MNKPTGIDVSELDEPGVPARFVAGPTPLEVTDDGEVIHIIAAFPGVRVIRV
ncbi:hypothetical protein [Streptomyces sp. NPDC127084]|uniref:hypothetical protein n=1 Tax=Streptomyces sp. NPDC127084 TaxID=3347133 RepID=UPI00365A529F